MFKHFLITRFNLSYEVFAQDRNGRKTLSYDWMVDRFALFEKFCLPSVANQSVKNFEWLVFFDNETPSEFKAKIDKYKQDYSFFTPIFVGNPLTQQSLEDSVNFKLSPEDSYLISTRIDNDDAIHKDFLLEIQKLFNYQEDCFINFTYGYQWHVDRSVLIDRRSVSGHFPSRIEKIQNGVKSVFVDHSKIQEIIGAQSMDIDNSEKPMWIEVIHDTNVRNRHRVAIPQFNNSVIENFNLDVKIDQKNSMIMFFKYLKQTPFKKVLYVYLKKFLSKIGFIEQIKRFKLFFTKHLLNRD